MVNCNEHVYTKKFNRCRSSRVLQFRARIIANSHLTDTLLRSILREGRCCCIRLQYYLTQMYFSKRRRRYQRKSIKDVNIDCIQSYIWGEMPSKTFNSGLITFISSPTVACQKKPFLAFILAIFKEYMKFPPSLVLLRDKLFLKKLPLRTVY